MGWVILGSPFPVSSLDRLWRGMWRWSHLEPENRAWEVGLGSNHYFKISLPFTKAIMCSSLFNTVLYTTCYFFLLLYRTEVRLVKLGLKLRYVCALSHLSCVWLWLFVTLWLLLSVRLLWPWGFSRQGYWVGLPYPPPEDLPDPGVEPMSLISLTLAGRFFITGTTCKAQTKVCEVKVAQSYLNLCDPMDYTIHEIL